MCGFTLEDLPWSRLKLLFYNPDSLSKLTNFWHGISGMFNLTFADYLIQCLIHVILVLPTKYTRADSKQNLPFMVCFIYNQSGGII